MSDGKQVDEFMNGRFEIGLDDGSSLVVSPHVENRPMNFFVYRTTGFVDVFGLLSGEDKPRKHFISLGHIVRVSPYFELAPEIESVGSVTVEEPSSDKLPPFEASEY